MSQNMNENFKEEQPKEVDSLKVKKEEKEKDIIFDELFIEYLNQGIGEPHFLF